MKPVFYEKRTENIFIGEICTYPFPSHVHDVVEIVCLQTGSMEMTVSGKSIMLLPGDIAVAFPSEAHSYDYVSKDASGLSLIFLPDTIMEFYHTFRTMQPVQPLLLHQDKAMELTGIISHLQKITAIDQNTLPCAELVGNSEEVSPLGYLLGSRPSFKRSLVHDLAP